jgi:hypothetical protein
MQAQVALKSGYIPGYFKTSNLHRTHFMTMTYHLCCSDFYVSQPDMYYIKVKSILRYNKRLATNLHTTKNNSFKNPGIKDDKGKGVSMLNHAPCHKDVSCA